VPLTHGNFAALSRLVTSPRTRTWVFLAVAALVTAIAAALTFRRAITPWSTLPDSDYWGNISGIVTESGVRLGLDTLLRHNNEHIVVIPKLVYAANYLVTSGSNTGLIVYSLAVGIAITALLLFLARKLLIDMPWRLLLCALLFPLVMFTSDRRKMGEFANPLWVKVLAWLVAVIIAGLNMWLLWQTFRGWLSPAGPA